MASRICQLFTVLCLCSTLTNAFSGLWRKGSFHARQASLVQRGATLQEEETVPKKVSKNKKPSIVLVAGFESFNRALYDEAAKDLGVDLQVFADSDIRIDQPAVNAEKLGVNPEFERAMLNADAFIGSLVFDYDDVQAVNSLIGNVKGPRLVFECATELMEFNKVGTFSMKPKDGVPSGPPPAVKAVLSKFSSGKEEDKINGYLKLLKIGPTLLKYVPGDKASDLRTWLEAYRFWNQGGKTNFKSMLQVVTRRCESEQATVSPIDLPALVVTPDVGLIHPLKHKMPSTEPFFESPAAYLNWRLSKSTRDEALRQGFTLAPADAPRAAVLLYRKHVITEQKYILDLIRDMEKQGVLPIPIFINGVEAHTIVRDMLTSDHEIRGAFDSSVIRDKTYDSRKAVSIDVIINTVGFPLVGGPAGSIEAGRNVDVSAKLLGDMNIPYIVASPLLLQSIPQWKQNGVLGLQAVALYSLPELDGAIDTVVLGGLVGDKIALVPERVRKLTSRVKGWVNLKRTERKDRKIAISLYGFPPNVGAVGTAALLDVPKSLENLLRRLDAEGYDVGDFARDPDACGESLVAALAILCEDPVISGGPDRMADAVQAKIERATKGDQTVATTLAKPLGGLGSAKVRAVGVTFDELEEIMGKYMSNKVRRAWPEKEIGPGVSSNGEFVVAGIQLGNVWLTVQPLLGFEGDPMRLLFERDLTPHPQYCASYKWTRLSTEQGGIGAQSIIHFGMHGTVEWLPGMPLGNDRQSWSDELLGDIPNVYIYAANNPSESILAKRRGYGTLVSYNVPPYGRAGLYLELANLKEVIDEYRGAIGTEESDRSDLRSSIWATAQKSGMFKDVPLLAEKEDATSEVTDAELPPDLSTDAFDSWILGVNDYLALLQERLFSSGLHVLGSEPSDEALQSYLEAYYGDKMTQHDISAVISKRHNLPGGSDEGDLQSILKAIGRTLGWSESSDEMTHKSTNQHAADASNLVSLLSRSTEEMSSVINALDGGFVPAAPGGDLLRDGPAVLPTGRNIHALDPYRMPSEGAWVRGQRIAKELIRQHQEANNGNFPETVAVTLWGLDAIKTRGESVAIALALAGAKPVKEGTGRIVRFDLIPLEELKRPRIDVLASLSGIFRDSFANVVDLLDDMFERAAVADEPSSMNYIKKHSSDLAESGVERPAARLFSNPPGDYGSMVNERVGSGDWKDSDSLGETWASRNSFSYGRNEASGNNGKSRTEVLEKLLETTERIVQEIDSVEYGLTDIQEYYANTGALKKAAENRKQVDPTTGRKKKVQLSIVEAFSGGTDENESIPVRDVDDVLRLEYRSKLLNPKWTEAMLSQGSGGAFEISQRMTAMIGWGATTGIDNFVFDQAAERYALDEAVAKKLQQSNPEAFKNVVRRLLEAAGRDMWDTDEATLEKLRDLYSDADDLVEQGSAVQRVAM